ncbi:pyridoxamine 5'-phosphate oxidase family protein [Fodinicola acaciae]|uniref:pyridoxamine 5'-phosphate oxidase family protein n=1 Tax=Fodinicola acaciae TaxID=2681555 RepID=UPI0013D892C8|nr:TIGR03618 family F420-dependent PPOX class oxidoreductase [Fodinicola acaciae]
MDPLTVTQGYGPGRGPGPIAQPEDKLSELLGSQDFGVLATVKRDGTPHLTTMSYSWSPEERLIRITSVDDRIKVRHIRNDPRAALHVSTADHLAFVVAEGRAEVSEVTTVPGDATGRELLSIQKVPVAAADEERFFHNMVEDRRLVIRIHVTHVYSGGLGV